MEKCGRQKVLTKFFRLQDITVLMYKVKHGLVPDCVSELFVRKSSTHSLRNSDFVLPRFETIRYGKHSVRYLGPFLWSKLTENQRDSPSLRVFINKIRKLNLDEIVINNSNIIAIIFVANRNILVFRF